MGFFSALRRSRSGSSFRDGSSRRGRRFGSGKSGLDEPSTGKESSTHSALFDLELSSRGGRAGDYLARLNSSVTDDGSAGGAADPSVRLPNGLLQRIIYLGRPVMEFELDLLQDVRAVRASCSLGPDGQLDLACMVTQLQDLGYACYLKHNNPADPGHRHNVHSSCLEKLRHEYVMCAGRADGSLGHWCMVDPRFREQFAIAQPTAAYDRLLKAVPLEFVGTPLRLQALVETLCSEMAEAFAAQQRTLPPWRKFKSMLSKWFDPEEMPAMPPPTVLAQQQQQQQAAQQQHAHPGGAQVQVHAASGPPPSPVDVAAVAATAADSVLREPTVGTRPSLLQQQAAAALAERQSSVGGSQDFFDALKMHKQSMLMQQQATAAGPAAQRHSPPRPPLAESAQQVQQQAQQPARLSSDTLRQLDASYAATTPGSSSADRSGSGERSNKPRRRRLQALAGGLHHAGAVAGLWADDGDESGRGGGGLGALGTQPSSGIAQLYATGSWSELSTILERSNNSSPATAALLTAGNAAPLGTSCASRRSAGSVAVQPPRRSPGRLDQLFPAVSQPSAPASQPSSESSPAGFAPAFAQSSQRPPRGPASSAQPSPTGSGGAADMLARGGGGGGAAAAEGAASEGSGRGGRNRVVSLLARGLKSVGQQQAAAWASLLPAVNTVRRVGPNGLLVPQRNRSWRGGGTEEGSSRRGRCYAGATLAQ